MNSILFDTSALLALYVEEHPNHEPTLNFFLDRHADNSKLFVANHSLAEFYRHITSGRKYLAYTPAQAQKIINQAIINYFEPITLDHSDYLLVIDAMKNLALHGAIIYDGLIARSAAKAGVTILVTYNIKDFQRIWPLTEADFIEP